MVDLRKDYEEITEKWRSSDEPHVPLPLAAALTLHEVQDDKELLVPQPEYEGALNLVAAALSRFLPIYVIDGRAKDPVPVQLSLAAGRFRDGATRYERNGGQALRSLVVSREDVPAAMEAVKAAHILIDFCDVTRP